MNDQNLRVPDHELLSPIGNGGYGQVWLTRSITGTYRAVKIIRRRSFDHDRPYEREFSGVKNFEPLSHTHEGYLRIFHVGRNDAEGYFYYIMELADDANSSREIHPQTYIPRTLRGDLKKNGRFGLDQCVEVGLQIASALEHLHGQKPPLIHRDIKPSNIVFVHGKPKLADIGLITAVSDAQSSVGTDGYTPPEGAGNVSADLFSLGKVLYEMGTGLSASDFPDAPSWWKRETNLTALRELNNVTLRACNSDPKARYESARELKADLVRVRLGHPVLPGPKKRLKRVMVGVVSGTLVAAAALLATRVRERDGPFVFDDFGGPTIRSNLWTMQSPTNFARGTNVGSARFDQTNDALEIEAQIPPDKNTQSRPTWVQSEFDLKRMGDCQVQISLASQQLETGEAAVEISEGRDIAEDQDLASVKVFSIRPFRQERHTKTNNVTITILNSEKKALVWTEEATHILNLSALKTWKLRFFVRAFTSRGFREGYAKLSLKEVSVRPLQETTGLFLILTNSDTGLPVKQATISVPGLDPVLTSGNGSAFLPSAIGKGKAQINKVGYQSKDIVFDIHRRRRTFQIEALKQEAFEIGDPKSYIVLATNVFAIENSSNCIYALAKGEGDKGDQVFKLGLDGRALELLGIAAKDCRGIASVGDSLWLTRAHNGAIYKFCRGKLAQEMSLSQEYEINWPMDCAWDGQHLWFLERDTISNRFSLVAFDLAAGQLVKQFAINDPLIRGLAWDGENFWIASDDGHLYSVDIRNQAPGQPIDVSRPQKLDGNYISLSFSAGFLWGLDPDMKRIFKINVSENPRGSK